MKTKIETTVKEFLKIKGYDFDYCYFHTLEELCLKSNDNGFTIGYLNVLTQSEHAPKVMILRDYVFLYHETSKLPECNFHMYSVHSTK